MRDLLIHFLYIICSYSLTFVTRVEMFVKVKIVICLIFKYNNIVLYDHFCINREAF
jgi:hypothetical protein